MAEDYIDNLPRYEQSEEEKRRQKILRQAEDRNHKRNYEIFVGEKV